MTNFYQRCDQYLKDEADLASKLRDTSFQSVFQQWIDSTLEGIDRSFERCQNELNDMQNWQRDNFSEGSDGRGSYWNPCTLRQHCNLLLPEQRLIKKGGKVEEHTSWPDLVRLVSAFNILKAADFVTPQQVNFLEQVEKELASGVVFSPWELRCIASTLETKLKDDSGARSVYNELTKYQGGVDELSPDLDSCEQCLHSATQNGDMCLAEQIAWRQLDLYEQMLSLICKQYPIVGGHSKDLAAQQRLRRWAIFRMANKDVTAVAEGKRRQAEACKEDLVRIKEQLENYSADDSLQRRRYEEDLHESDNFLADNKEKQQGVWNRIYELFRELQGCQGQLRELAETRAKEVERRVRVEKREASRRDGHEGFIAAAAEHAERLQHTIENTAAARNIATSLGEFVLDGCASIADRVRRQQEAMAELLRLVQRHHFKCFSDFYLAAGRMQYKKEQLLKKRSDDLLKANVQLKVASDSLDPEAKRYALAAEDLTEKRNSVAAEIVALRKRIADATNAVAPVLQSFDAQGIHYVHPAVILEKVVSDRRERMLDYRELVNPEVPEADTIMADEVAALARDSEAVETQTLNRLAARAARAERAAQHAFPQPPAEADASTTRSYMRMQELLSDKSGSRGTYEQDSGNTSAITSVKKKSAPRPAVAAELEGAAMRALYPYKAKEDDELSFDKGDIIICVGSALEEGWLRGLCNQRAGLFPINYVVKEEESNAAGTTRGRLEAALASHQ